MQQKWWKKVLSTALSLVMCGSLIAPAFSGVTAAVDDTIKIACVGDSITAGSQASSSAFHYPTQLQSLLGSGYEVKNFGSSGRTLLSKGDNPYIQDGNYAKSQDFQPDYVTIMLGTNDSKPQNWAYKDEFEADMKAMIEAYRALDSHPVVIIATSPTVGASYISISDAVVTDEIVPVQKKVAAEMGCPVIDINALTKGMPQNYADGIHPNDTGYTLMAEMFYNGLQDIFNARIKGFAVNGVDAVIDDGAGTIALTVPHGTDLTAIEPTITLADGAKIDKTGSQNFTNPVSYTVTSPDGKQTKTYTVTVTPQPVIKVACIGDSITAGVGNSGGNSYPDQLGRLLGAEYEVKNFGYSGATVQDDGRDQDQANTAAYGYRLTDKYQQSLAYGADIVIVMMGANDSKDINWKDGDNRFEQDWRALIQDYLDLPQHPTVLVGTACAVYKTSWTINDEVTSGEIAPIQRQVAAEMGLTLVDANALTQGHSEYYIADGVHLNDTGYAAVADAMRGTLQQMMTTLDSFTMNGAVGVIDDGVNTVAVTLPAATDITSLEPVLAIPAGAAYTPAGPQDFTESVTYTVTAADGITTRDYTVTVKLLDKIKVACVGDSMTAATTYPDVLEGNLGAGYEVGRFGQNSTTVQKDGLKENGANPNSGAYMSQSIYQQSLAFQPDIVLLMLGANDSKQGEGQAQSGHNLVTNWKEDSPENYEADLIDLVNSYLVLDSHPIVIMATSPSGYATEGNWAAKPEIVNSQIAPIQRKVASELGCFLVDFNAYTQGKENNLISGDGLHPSFYGYYQLAGLHYMAIQDAQAAILSLSINGEPGLISQIDKTVYVTVPDGTDLTALNPTVSLSDGAVVDKTGSQGFGQPVTYIVTAANGHTSEYTVTVTSPSGVTVAKIEMQTPPEKISYLLGERLDTTGASIAVVYTDGSRETVDVTEEMVSGYDWLNLGKQALTVIYEGKTTTYTVQVMPHGVVGSFSAREGKARVLNNGDSLLYGDWKWADQYPLDLSDGEGNANPNLSLEMDVTFGSEQDVDPADMWQHITIKLRSTDVANKEGDPNLPENGGSNANNAEHNYGWDLQATTFADPAAIHISIPLNTASTNSRGIMDWSEVGRLIVIGNLKNEYRTNSVDHYMDIQNIYIIDNTQIPTTPDTAELEAAIAEVEEIDTDLYTDETVAAFERTLALAAAYLSNPYASADDIARIIDELETAAAALEEKPVVDPTPKYMLGDVDNSGKIEAADALLALQAATGKVNLTETQTMAANVDGKDGVTASAALLILQYATGKIARFPIEETE